MGDGHLSAEQAQALRPHLQGQVVHDLGAGTLELTKRLVKLGAERVVAVDQLYEFGRKPLGLPDTIEVIGAYFEQCQTTLFPKVAFISWPSNFRYNPALTALCARADVLIYLGLNDDSTCCGSKDLFEHMLRRELLGYHPYRRNNLIILGEVQKSRREPTPEEDAGLRAWGARWSTRQDRRTA